MFGITWLTPKCVIRETIHRKHHHYLYITRHYDNGLIELWAERSKMPNYSGNIKYHNKVNKKAITLGKIVGDRWIKPKDFYDLERPMQTMSEWVYQNRILNKKVDYESARQSTRRSLKDMKRAMEGKKVYTREDFVNFGKMGQERVKEKYGKGSIFLRWENKLSTQKALKKK